MTPRRPTLRRGRTLLLYAVLITLGSVAMVGVAASQTGQYVVLSWNDLGMHSSNKLFGDMALLPPFNTLRAQVILKNGGKPSLVNGAGLDLSYSIPGNTYSVGKTDFWSYAQALFGQQPEPNVGLTGNGLTGNFAPALTADHYEATGIPLTPYADDDLATENPFQLAQVVLKGGSGQVMASTKPVVPVSTEINCISSGCHGSEGSIIAAHSSKAGLNTSEPVLCASCHQSNALGTTGVPEAKSLSERIHSKHAGETNDCYKCHPGPKTRSLRDVMSTKSQMKCKDCHGNVSNVAKTISAGRKPWLDEPDCGKCHGSNHANQPGKLYRESKGHGGLYCSACHGSPHVIFPSREPADNAQNIALQGAAGTLQCVVCHDAVPSGAGPHGLAAGSAKKTGSGGASCSSCHSDGRTGPLPAGHKPIGGNGGTAVKAGGTGLASGAKSCSSCHSDGRSGSLPPGHRSIGGASGGTGTAAKIPARSTMSLNSRTASKTTASKTAVPSKTAAPTRSGGSSCSRCHSDGRSGSLPAGHRPI